MNRKLRMSLVLSSALVLSAAWAQAQRGGPGGPPPFGEPMELMGFEGTHGGQVVKNAPFSATATSETTQTLQDGTVIRHTSQIAMFRDSQGRSRHEVTFSGFGPLAASGTAHTMVSIGDPVAGAHFMLDAEHKVARKMPIRTPDADKAGAFQKRMQERIQRDEASGAVKTESLGTQPIGGVNAEGTRTTRTIPAGQIGNDKPIQVTSERWYSPDLQIVVKSTRTDPRFGNTTYSVTNIQRTEPAASLFTVPADYTVETGRPRREGRLHHAPDVPPPGPGAPPPGDLE